MKKKLMIALTLCFVATGIAVACDCECLIEAIIDNETTLEDAIELGGAYIRDCM